MSIYYKNSYIFHKNICIFFSRTEDPIKVYENLLTKVYSPLCSGNFSGYLDDEPPPRLSLTILQQHVIPILQYFVTECQKAKVSHLEVMSNSLINKLEAIHGTSFKLSSGHSSATSTASTQPSFNSMTSSTSMDEMKQKVGKLFHSGQQFWKK